MNPLLSTYTWVSLSNEQRNRIRSLFSIPRSSHVVVNDGRVETDGTTPADLAHLTVEKMQAFLKEESTDFHRLFDRVLERVQDDIEGKPAAEVTSPKPTEHAKKAKNK